ncbi:MAG: hypothetical protein ACOC0M_10665 [Halomonas sp.]
MTVLLFALFLVFMLLGVPIAMAIGASTLVALHARGCRRWWSPSRCSRASTPSPW